MIKFMHQITTTGGLLCLAFLTGCGNDNDVSQSPPQNELPTTFSVNLDVGVGGSASESSGDVESGKMLSITLTPDEGFEIESASGCNGILEGSVFTTATINANCEVKISFKELPPEMVLISTISGAGGNISPKSSEIESGTTTSFTVVADEGFNIESVQGCGGSLEGNTFITGIVSMPCEITAAFEAKPAPDSTQVVAYLVTRPPTIETDTQGITELFAVDRDGLNSVMLNAELPEEGDVLEFSWSPTGERIAYRGTQDGEDTSELYGVFPDATGRIKYNGSMVAGANVSQFSWAPDGRSIAYVADQDTLGIQELYVVQANGGGRVKVSSELNATGDVQSLKWSADAQYILYTADGQIDGKNELYLATTDGSNTRKVNLDFSNEEEIIEYRFSPNQSFVSYVVAEQSGSPSPGSEGSGLLGTFRISDGAEVTLSKAGKEVQAEYQWFADETRIIVACEQFSEGCEGSALRTIGLDNAGLQVLNINVDENNSSFQEGQFYVKTSNEIVVFTLQDGAASYIYFDASGKRIDVEELTEPRSDRSIFRGVVASPNERYIGVLRTDAWIYDTQSKTGFQLVSNGVSSIGVQSIMWNEDSSHVFVNTGLSDFTGAGVLADANGSVILDENNFFSEPTTLGNYLWYGDRLYFSTLRASVGMGSINSISTSGTEILELSQPFQGNPATEIGKFAIASNGAFLVYDVEGATNPLNSNLNNEGEAIYAVDLNGENHVRLNPVLEFTSEIREYQVNPAL